MASIRTPLIVLSLALAGGVAYWLLRESPPPAADGAPAAIPVTMQAVEQRDVTVPLRALGYVRALRSIDVRPQIEGTLVELPVAEGQRVRKGELLARIDDRAIRAALQQAEAERQVTRAELDIARLDLRRYGNLVRDRAAPAQTLDQQKALVARLDATLATRDAALAAAQVQLSYTRILSPTDGRIGIRNAYEGSLVRSGDAMGLFSVVQTDPISIEATLPQTYLPQLQRMLARPEGARVQAFYQDGGPVVAVGRMTLMDNRVAVDSGTIRVKAEFANSDERLWPDQSVLVSFAADTLPQALLVPARAIRQGSDGAFVWRVVADKAEPVPVKVLQALPEQSVIEGLSVGDLVVTDGQSRLRPGIGVRAASDQPVAAAGAQR